MGWGCGFSEGSHKGPSLRPQALCRREGATVVSGMAALLSLSLSLCYSTSLGKRPPCGLVGPPLRVFCFPVTCSAEGSSPYAPDHGV